MKKMDRRDFLITTGALGALASATSHADTRIRVGMLGTQHGHFQGKLQTLQASPEFEVAAACERNPAALAEMKKSPRYTGLRYSGSADLGLMQLDRPPRRDA